MTNNVAHCKDLSYFAIVRDCLALKEAGEDPRIGSGKTLTPGPGRTRVRTGRIPIDRTRRGRQAEGMRKVNATKR
jgi:hypothetical protein